MDVEQGKHEDRKDKEQIKRMTLTTWSISESSSAGEDYIPGKKEQTVRYNDDYKWVT